MIPLNGLREFPADDSLPSPNHSSRRGNGVRWLIFHATADGGNERGSLDWLTSDRSQVSAHLFVSRAGRVTRMVADHESAWHAGASHWPPGPKGVDSLNVHTIGVEFANRNDGEPLTDAQYQAAAKIAAWYVAQGLDLKQGVLAHYHISPGRKTDPVGFDWRRFNKLASDRIRRVHP
jgi:N-acetyl-anhydromuramyl-L-alanine amidase AmpD